jgi:hypothetical protein
LLQHFLPHGTCPLPHCLQRPRSGSAQRHRGGQQFGPHRERPRGHFGMQICTVRAPTRKRTHSVDFGQQRLPQTCSSAGHGLKQTTPRTQTSCGSQQCFVPGGPQNERPSSQITCSWQRPLPVGEQLMYHGQHEPAKPSDV